MTNLYVDEEIAELMGAEAIDHFIPKNPFARGTDLHSAWCSGYMEAGLFALGGEAEQ